MDPQEVKDRLKNVFVNLVKDDKEAAQAELHDVLAAKMRNRVNPETASKDMDSFEDDSFSDEEESEE